MRKKLERDRSREPLVEAVSRSLWPWPDALLLASVGLVAALDYVSTFAFLELSGSDHVYEAGPIASWALRQGGFGGLFLADVTAVGILILLALVLRSLHFRFGFRGYGRATFVIVLLPYFVVTLAAVFNNIILTFI
ncbi:MAG: hypothetical protein HY667_00225 [Chloroflexi bacterium]|nr:hypothetical protein [Chloroflexota bacterium]